VKEVQDKEKKREGKAYKVRRVEFGLQGCFKVFLRDAHASSLLFRPSNYSLSSFSLSPSPIFSLLIIYICTHLLILRSLHAHKMKAVTKVIIFLKCS